MKKIYIQNIKTEFGELILGSYDDHLCLCDWRYRKMRSGIDNRIKNGLQADFVVKENETIKTAIRQLNEYFAGERNQFDIPIQMVGTDFQKKIWNGLLKIPYGKTESYLGLSKKTGDAMAIRAVAAANGANAISIFVPCHRIIGSNGELTGYAGGVEVKKKLLQLESGRIIPEQMQLFG